MTRVANTYVCNSGVVPVNANTIYWYKDGESDGVWLHITDYYI